MNGVQGNQAAQVRMFAHDAIPVALGAVNPDSGITLDSGGYAYNIGDTIVLNTGTGTSPVAAQLKVTTIGKQDIINVQAQSGQQFFLNGIQLDTDKLELIRGKTYTFYQKASSNGGHILAFSSTDPDDAPTSYTDGVVATGTEGVDRVIKFTVASNAPSQLWYYCTAHTGMQGEIEVKDSGDDFFNTYPNNNAVKSFDVIRLTTAKPFGKGYVIGNKVQPAVETYSKNDPSAFIGEVANIDLASTNERGACIYVGVKMTSMEAKMESGKLTTFKAISAGSFMPVLVKQITTATPDGGSAGVISDNDIIALY
jgi:hypothetical protein